MGNNVIDFQDALDRVQDDKELLFELFDIFEEDFQNKRVELDKHLDQNNAEMVRNIAHSLKGASGNISAECIHELCFLMEKQASENDLESVRAKLPDLDTQFSAYQKEARRIREEDEVL